MVCESTSNFTSHIHGFCSVESDGNIIGHSDLIHDGDSIGFYGSTPVTKPSALTTSNTGTIDIIYGPVERDVINNLRVRLNELESKLKSLGLLS